ncbi:MAG: mechanosensitive ion channel family protein [Rhodothermaceae bacterium]|nr:mechanosensitive ion channel family protein [Rhodothermaceae bacterium]
MNRTGYNSTLLIALLIGLLSMSPATAGAQVVPDAQDYERLLNNPRRTVHTFLNWQMKGHRQPELAATTMIADPALDLEERIDRASQLLKVLDARGLIIDLESIPGEREYTDTLSGMHTYILFQTLPEVFLVRQDTVWVFSKSTVDIIPDLYRSTFSIFVDVVVDNLPGYMHRELGGLTLWQYIALFFWILIGLVLRSVTIFLLDKYALKLTQKTSTKWDDLVVKEADKPISFVVMILFYLITYTNLMLPVTVNYFLRTTFEVALLASLIWLLYGMVNVLSEYLASVTAKTESTLDEQLVPLLRKTLKIFIIVIGVLFILQNKGINVTSVLAGLGIGGLAVALAARDTLANFFGSITIFADRPFRIGDWIKIGDMEGVVEEVGFRTTRVRTFYNSLVSVPNARVADSSIDNLGMRQFRRILTRLNLTYSTTPEQMEAFVEGLKAIVQANPYTRKDFFEIHFNEFGSHSLDVLFYVFLKVPSWSDELQQRHNIFLEILKMAKEVGVEFAYPTQTLHIDSFYGDKPRQIGRDVPVEQLGETVSSFGPEGGKSSPGGVKLTYNGKEVDFGSAAFRRQS